MDKKSKLCLVSCSVLRDELEKLVKERDLDSELVFVSKFFHVDYDALEENLRKVLEHTIKRFKGRVILLYGDLCLGQDNEMQKLAQEYRVSKIDAVNCIDCPLGGKGRFKEADQEHNLMFMGPGMIGFFKGMKEKMLREGIDEATFAKMFSGIKGFVPLDTCGDADKWRVALEQLGMGLEVLETRRIGLSGIRQVVLDAIEQTRGIN